MIVLRNLFSGKISACSFMIAIVLGLMKSGRSLC